MQKNWTEAILQITDRLEQSDIHYTLKGAGVLAVFDQAVPEDQASLECEFQWDQLKEVYELFDEFSPSKVKETETGATFNATLCGISVGFFCRWNVALIADPARVDQKFQGKSIYIEALTEMVNRLNQKDLARHLIKDYLKTLQDQNTSLSREAWNTGTYAAWVKRFGEPSDLGAAIKNQPDRRLITISDYIGDLSGRHVLNLMGSNAIKAVAMACMGAHVTVADLSEESAQYANELAHAAGVDLTYIVGDVLNSNEVDLKESGADLILMERGILHYFVDLEPIMSKVTAWLKPGGCFVLQDFHPISTKLIDIKGKKQVVAGNYFDRAIHQTPVATSKYSDQDAKMVVNQRRWTLGEVVTAIGQAGLKIRRLDERPNEKKNELGIPKMFTIVAEK